MTDHNETKTALWNKYFTPNLKYLEGFLGQPQWYDLIAAYLLGIRNILQEQLNLGLESLREEDKVRGRILAINELLELPIVIGNQLGIEAEKKPAAKPAGTAGY
jgi:hypothetical protein